jgi:putative Ca2+/H+ antiporter (TMEM165/GDT1 family)
MWYATEGERCSGTGVDASLSEGILSGFLLILFSELGDKTFFIAVLLALKESKTLVFIGTFGALGVMTLISVGIPPIESP